MGIARGDRVIVENALGERSERVAMTGVVQGHDFMVVWVCRPDEWEAAQREGRDPVGMPYPKDDVYAIAPA